MWFSKTHVLQDLVAALKAENSDLRAQVRFLTQSAHDRETKLIDRILAVSNPAAHREIHPPPERAPRPQNGGIQRVGLPGVGMIPPPAPRSAVAGTQVGHLVHTQDEEGADPSPAPTPDEPEEPS